MCGICGYVGHSNSRVLESMMNALLHRGPDGAGSWSQPGVGLGMRRLAIVDLDQGQQPFFSEDKKIVSIFNGEIYNHAELRAQLQSLGHCFTSNHADGEVIVHAYEQWGDDFLHHLNGMFAIAVWDDSAKRLLLARDRVGIKPLFYTVDRGKLYFASELKSIFASGQIEKAPNYHSLHHYFSFKNIPAPFTAYQKVAQLKSGELLIFKNGRVETKRWWQPNFNDNNYDAGAGEQAASERVMELLQQSVARQMCSDVAVGAFLSGGVDSSAVVALMSQISVKPIKTFTLAYEDNFTNKNKDRELAALVSKKCNTDHHERVIRCKDLPENIDQITRAFDEPFSGVISTYFLTELIQQHVKVALSGDGADELFASYLPHRLAFPLANYIRHDNKQVANGDFAPFDNQLDFLNDISRRGDEAARRMALYVWDDQTKSQLFNPALIGAGQKNSSEALVRNFYTGLDIEDPLNRCLAWDFESLLPDQVLTFVDRLSMAHGVEVRPPFLDHHLVEFVARLPGHYKIKNGVVKNILKNAVKDLLPEEVVFRPKEGFVMPINDWIVNQLDPWVRDLLAPGRLAKHDLFNSDYVAQLIKRHYDGRQNNGNKLWNLMMFQIWWENNDF